MVEQSLTLSKVRAQWDTVTQTERGRWAKGSAARGRERSKSHLLLPTVSAEGMCVRKWVLHMLVV